MKKLFYTGLILLGLFEVVNVYFIMPMPGSQRMNSLDLAYFLYSYRWVFRMTFSLMIVAGTPFVVRRQKLTAPFLSIAPVVVIVYLFNFRMTADHMFLPPKTLRFASKTETSLSDSSLVIAVALGQEAKAYPVRYIQYHHQVRDTIAGKPIMVTYCNVCRTGRVFEPVVDGQPEHFRLVGMDHFNAMFEDQTTKSWWRQVNGEAVTGERKGAFLPEVESSQYTLGKFFYLYPYGKVMQPDATFKESYDTLGRFEKGRSKNKLTRTDTLSWNDKSWVLGVEVGQQSKAYDWNELKAKKIIHDKLGNTFIVAALASDGASFVAIEREEHEEFELRNDSLISNKNRFDFVGRGESGSSAKRLKAYQEFWHSWREFHPRTEVYR